MSSEVAKTTKAAAKPKAPASHPKYSEMVKTAVSSLKERGGSSRQAILKYILENFEVGDEKVVNQHLKVALRSGVKNDLLKQSKGTGASGSFRLGEEAKKPAPKKVIKPKSVTATPKKTTKPPKAATKAKKLKTPKKDSKAKKVSKTPSKKTLKQPTNKAISKVKTAASKAPSTPKSKKAAPSTPKPKKTASKK